MLLRRLSRDGKIQLVLEANRSPGAMSDSFGYRGQNAAMRAQYLKQGARPGLGPEHRAMWPSSSSPVLLNHSSPWGHHQPRLLGATPPHRAWLKQRKAGHPCATTATPHPVTISPPSSPPTPPPLPKGPCTFGIKQADLQRLVEQGFDTGGTFSLEPAKLGEVLCSSTARGLCRENEEQRQQRRTTFGTNRLPPKKAVSFWELVKEALQVGIRVGSNPSCLRWCGLHA